MLNNRYVFLVFMLILAVINQIDRQLLVAFAPQITADLELSDAQFGLLSGIFFAAFYSIGGLLMGALSDHYNRPKILAIGLVIWSALTAATGLARNFIQISLARMLVSVGESSLTPTATTMLMDKFPANHTAAVIGIYFMGIPLGVGGSFLVAGLLGPIFGWRGSFLLLGGIGILFTVLVLLLKDPRSDKHDDAKSEGETVPSLKEIPGLVFDALKKNSTLRYAIAGFLVIHFFYASNMFSQLWLVREQGLDWQEMVTTYGLVSILAGVIGAFSGGFLSDWYSERFKGGRAAFVVIVSLLLAPLILSFRFTDPGSVLFYIALFSGFLFVNLVYGPVFSILQEVTPPAIKGTIIGFTMLSINVVSLGLGSLAIGMASDYFNAAGYAHSLTWILFVSDLATMLCIPCYLVVARRTFLRQSAARLQTPQPAGQQ